MADWRQKGRDKAQSVLDLIPPEWRISHIPTPEEQKDITGDYIAQFLEPKEIEITESEVPQIVKKTRTGVWRAVEVTKAFCHRAAIAHQLLNCLHEIFFEAAIADAERLDEYFATHKKPIGLLHGLPVSLKDQFHVKGVETTMGYVGWIDTFQGKKGTGREKVFESEMVRELRSLGAVLYVKTAVPQTLMCPETVNNIIGYTQNPKNRFLSSGGSSGGEGALIGARGSVVGFGTDIGGSIRIPAAFNGLYGLRPSSGRLPYEGMANSMDGQNSVLSVVGPLSTSAGGLKLIVKALLSTEPWLHDPRVHEIPWRDSAELAIRDSFWSSTNKLTFGVMRHDGDCAVTPPVARAIDMAVTAMERLGHHMVEWKPTPSHKTLTECAVECWGFDGGADTRRDFGLSGEDMAPQILNLTKDEVSASEIMAANIKKRALEKAYMDYWNSTASLSPTGRPVDAVILPLAPFPACRPGKFGYLAYSIFANVLDYTCAIVPITRVDKKIDVVQANFVPLNDVDAETQATYDPELYHGAHVSIQLLGRRLQEEKMIALARYVGEALREKPID